MLQLPLSTRAESADDDPLLYNNGHNWSKLFAWKDWSSLIELSWKATHYGSSHATCLISMQVHNNCMHESNLPSIYPYLLGLYYHYYKCTNCQC